MRLKTSASAGELGSRSSTESPPPKAACAKSDSVLQTTHESMSGSESQDSICFQSQPADGATESVDNSNDNIQNKCALPKETGDGTVTNVIMNGESGDDHCSPDKVRFFMILFYKDHYINPLSANRVYSRFQFLICPSNKNILRRNVL